MQIMGIIPTRLCLIVSLLNTTYAVPESVAFSKHGKFLLQDITLSLYTLSLPICRYLGNYIFKSTTYIIYIYTHLNRTLTFQMKYSTLCAVFFQNIMKLMLHWNVYTSRKFKEGIRCVAAILSYR